MRSSTVRLVACVALIALVGGCDQLKALGGKPKGQVVATVDGQEITLAELQAELGGATPANAQAAKALQQTALQRIIVRDLLAKAAHDQKLDQTPDFAVQLQRARKDLEATLLEKKMAGEVPPPQREEAERFVSDHPAMFAQRMLMTIEQVQLPMTNDPALLKALSDVKDLGQAEGVLDARHIPHQRSVTVVDTLQTDPRLTEALQKTGSNDVLIVPVRGALSINQVKDSHSVPVTGDAATQVALKIMSQQRTQQAVQKQAQAILASAKDKIKYNDAYKPTNAASPQSPAAAQPPAATDAGPGAPTAPNTPPATGQPFTLGK